jgi:hypothetical protein
VYQPNGYTWPSSGGSRDWAELGVQQSEAGHDAFAGEEEERGREEADQVADRLTNVRSLAASRGRSSKSKYCLGWSACIQHGAHWVAVGTGSARWTAICTLQQRLPGRRQLLWEWQEGRAGDSIKTSRLKQIPGIYTTNFPSSLLFSSLRRGQWECSQIRHTAACLVLLASAAREQLRWAGPRYPRVPRLVVLDVSSVHLEVSPSWTLQVMTPMRATALIIAGSITAAGELTVSNNSPASMFGVASVRIWCMKGYFKVCCSLHPLAACWLPCRRVSDPWCRHLASRTILEAFDSG